jgi:hypothetical protein
VCGSAGALEIDLHIERLVWHRVRHEVAEDGLWHPRFEDALLPHLPKADPVDIVESQLREFLSHVEARTEPEANARSCGVEIARLLEAIDRSSAERWPVALG